AMLAALSLTAVAAPARAIVISEDELEEESFEAGVIARQFAFVLLGEPLEPPLAPEDISPTGTGILDLRLYVVRKTATWQLVVHDQLTTRISAHDVGAGFPIGRGVPPPR